MAFDFDIIYVKGNIIPHVVVLSRLHSDSKRQETTENLEDEILQETDMLLQNHLRIETKQDLVLSLILDRIKRSTCSNCSMAKRPYKESKHKITVEKDIICNGNIIITPQSLRKKY